MTSSCTRTATASRSSWHWRTKAWISDTWSRSCSRQADAIESGPATQLGVGQKLHEAAGFLAQRVELGLGLRVGFVSQAPGLLVLLLLPRQGLLLQRDGPAQLLKLPGLLFVTGDLRPGLGFLFDDPLGPCLECRTLPIDLGHRLALDVIELGPLFLQGAHLALILFDLLVEGPLPGR